MAFLNGEFKEDIYMKQPEGWARYGKEHLICKLKSMYISMAWSSNYVLEMGILP